MESEQNLQQHERDYLEFIKVTRKHQAERERLRKLELKKNPPIEEYYIDISQVDTLALDNLNEAPKRPVCGDQVVGELVEQSVKEKSLIDLYGSRESYERIKSMEMHLNDCFKNKCRELKPHYWPVIPIIPKPYLNPIRK